MKENYLRKHKLSAENGSKLNNESESEGLPLQRHINENPCDQPDSDTRRHPKRVCIDSIGDPCDQSGSSHNPEQNGIEQPCQSNEGAPRFSAENHLLIHTQRQNTDATFIINTI